MRLFSTALFAAVVTLSLAAGVSRADEPKKDKKGDASVDAFFDDPKAAKPSSMDALNKATQGMANKEKKDGMAVKSAESNEEAPVNLHAAFAAQKIVMDKKLGCQPAGREKKKLTFFEFDELPQVGCPSRSA